MPLLVRKRKGILSKALADDPRFDVVEHPRHGIMIRLAATWEVAKDPAKGKQPLMEVSVLTCQDGYAAILDKPAGTTTEELIRQFEFHLGLDVGNGDGLQSVSRLDAPTSGALVVPLSQAAAEELKGRFATRSVTKAYLALVLGSVPEQGEVNAKLRSFQTVDRYRAVVHPYGKEAVTLFQRLAVLPCDEHCESYSLVLAWPLTGRMHQIRAHFAHLGFPLAGDVRYGPRKVPTARLGSRLFLHAAYVSVSTSLTAVSPLKADLLEPLKELMIDATLLEQLEHTEFYTERFGELQLASKSIAPGSDSESSESTENLEMLLSKENLSDVDPALGSRPKLQAPRAPQPERPQRVEQPEEGGVGG